MNTYPLSDVEDELILNDMNYQYQYKRIQTPDGNKSNLFSICFRDKSCTRWDVINGLLTTRFSACSTEDVINDIVDNLGAKLLVQKNYRDKTVIKSSILLSGCNIKSPPVNKVDRLIFKMLTNIDIENLANRSAISLNLINSFAGELAFQINYGMLNCFHGTDDDGKPKSLNITNLFVLGDFNHRLVHNNKLDISYNKIDDVKNQCDELVELYMSIKPHIGFMVMLEKKSTKKFFKSFVDIYQSLPEDSQNLYYASSILSLLLESKQMIYREIVYRNLIRQYVEEHIKSL